MSLLIKLMQSKFAAAGAVVVIALIIIVMGPRFHLVRPWNFLVAGLVLLGWLAWIGYKKLQARKNASALEGFLHQQADDQLLTARPDVKDEIAALKEKMERAIRTLKQSKLGKGRRGVDALYVLPWYMIIGPSACGKSTAIRNSGLSFPPIDPDSDSPGAIKGLGGTRNCDWWFTNEGIVLDTAGRYTISVDAAEDREEWSAFLGLLKKFRKKSPINGLLVMVSVDELLQQTEDGIEAHAKNIRQRIDELMVKLGIIFPVYLVFTKCDLLSGFVEFFGDLSKREREQVWGYTCKFDVERTAPIHEEFRRETEKLLDVLAARRMRKFSGDLRPGDERKVYLFPLEFEAARRKLTGFLETMFQANPFQQNPALRGVYFTSGTQEGTPIGQVIASMAREFGIQGDLAALLEPPKEPKAYFIKDLFTQIIMTDRAAARPTAASAKRSKWTRLALSAGVGIAAILLVVALLTSYFGNRSLLAQTQDAAKSMKDRIEGRGVATLPADLDAMERLHKHLQTLDQYDTDVPPLRLRWGLYKGETVNRAARQVLMQRITDLLMKPTVAQFEDYLRDTMKIDAAEENERLFDVCTAYMMPTEPPETAPKDVGALVEQTNFVWARGTGFDPDAQGDFSRLADPLVRYWWTHRADPDATPIVLAKDRGLSHDVDQYILKTMSVDKLYRKMIRDISGEIPEFTVEGAVPGTTVLTGNPVKGAYTKIGWEKSVSAALAKSRDQIEQDPVLKQALGGSKDIEKRLFALYVDGYKRAWREFFDGLQVSPFANAEEAVEGLGELADEKKSPIIELLNKVADNAEIKKDGDRVQEIYDEFSGINDFLGRSGALGGVAPGPSESAKKYAEMLANASGKLEEAQAAFEGAKDCGAALKTLGRALSKEQEKTEKLIPAGQSPLSRSASKLLGRPVEAVRAVGGAGACACLNAAWDAKVRQPFEEKLAGLYPFNAHGPDAPLSDVLNFFGGSGGGIGAFVEAEGRAAEEAGMALSGAYREAVEFARRVKGIVAGNALSLSFTLTARAPQFNNVSDATFVLGSKTFTYRMGSEKRYDFTWGVAGGGDCSLSLIPVKGQQVPPLRKAGDWGLFRVLDEAQVRGGAVSWTFDAAGSATLTAGYELSGPGASFVQAGHFKTFKCPTKVCGE